MIKEYEDNLKKALDEQTKIQNLKINDIINQMNHAFKDISKDIQEIKQNQNNRNK